MELTWGCARRPLLGGTDPGWQLDTTCMRNGHKEKETRNENPRPPPLAPFSNRNAKYRFEFTFWLLGQGGVGQGGKRKDLYDATN